MLRAAQPFLSFFSNVWENKAIPNEQKKLMSAASLEKSKILWGKKSSIKRRNVHRKFLAEITMFLNRDSFIFLFELSLGM